MRVVLFILLVYTNSLNAQHLVGNYTYANPDFGDRLYAWKEGIDMISVGESLRLFTDSSFLYLTCGDSIRGKWKTDKQYIYLFMNSFRYRNPELDKKYGELLKKSITDTCLIYNRRLYIITRLKNGSKSLAILKKD